MLDVAFSSLVACGALGDENDPLESISVPWLLAVVYAIGLVYAFGWSSKMLPVNLVDFSGELEAAIDARGGLVDIGTVADANMATATISSRTRNRRPRRLYRNAPYGHWRTYATEKAQRTA